MKNDLRNLLVGCELKDGWKIGTQRCPRVGGTGACHSVGFIANHPDGNMAFVKVLDPTPDPSLEDDEQLKELERRLAVFNYESDLLEKCLTKRIRRVVRSLGRGSVVLPKLQNGIHYLLFELADCDLRDHATLGHTLNTALNMRILHQVALLLRSFALQSNCTSRYKAFQRTIVWRVSY